MEFGKKKVLGSVVLAASLIALIFRTLLVTTSAPALVVMAKPGPPGTYEIDIDGDASGLYMMSKMFEQFSVRRLEWSASLPSYPSGYVDIDLDVRHLDFAKVNDWTYHLSLKGLKEGSLVSTDYTSFIFSVRARFGELDFVFSDPYYSYYWTYRTVDITGTLKGDVLFHIDAPDIPVFHYEGPELTIRVHIGM